MEFYLFFLLLLGFKELWGLIGIQHPISMGFIKLKKGFSCDIFELLDY